VSDDLDPGYTVARTTLQSAFALPFAVTISSARERDGKTGLAVGLARNFARARFSTLVLDANPDSPAVAHALGIEKLAVPAKLEPAAVLEVVRSADGVDAASIAGYQLVDDASDAEIAALIAGLRARYDVTIVDTGEVFASTFVPRCAAACDGVVLAVRYARFPEPNDRRVVGVLERQGARVIGTVSTSFPREVLI
jgi:Mrp family chromosome partitioning ATPase